LAENLKCNSGKLQLEELSMLNAKQLCFYSQLVKDLGPILRNAYLCKIMILLATTFSTEASGSQMYGSHVTILKIFWKKMFDKFLDITAGEDGEGCEELASKLVDTLVGEVVSGLNKIRSFCTMLKT
jgi:hypothetical protein